MTTTHTHHAAASRGSGLRRAEAEMALRPATSADDAALRRLAALDSAAPLTGPVLLAELDGTLVAAKSLADHRAVADPFVRTAEVLDVLRAYAARLDQGTGAAGRRSPWSLPQRRHLHAAA